MVRAARREIESWITSPDSAKSPLGSTSENTVRATHTLHRGNSKFLSNESLSYSIPEPQPNLDARREMESI